MAVVLFRVDDRLVHGQVTAGWGRVLSPSRIVVINDSIAESDWEKDLYRSAVPEGIDFEVWTVEEAIEKFMFHNESNEKVFVLVEDLETVSRLVDGGLEIESVNIGGIHYEDGKQEVISYVYLSSADRDLLFELKKRGVNIVAQDVPTGKTTNIFAHLEKKKED
jgi:mannose/fructose/N-acetylgalactosamine-specific phosphotransferase system component IIB